MNFLINPQYHQWFYLQVLGKDGIPAKNTLKYDTYCIFWKGIISFPENLVFLFGWK